MCIRDSPQAVHWFVEDKLKVADGIVTQTDGASQVLL